MSFKTFTVIKLVVVIIMGGLIGWAVTIGNYWIPIPAVIAALVVLLLFRRGVKEEVVVVDERVYSIAEKASYLAFRIFGIAAAVIGATFVALGYEKVPELQPIGLTLAFATCGLVLIYYIAYTCYKRKYSGKK
jgi:uncharacterized membrane protein